MDGSLNFGWNHYKGTRGIVFTGLNRAALSDYYGQQYAAAAGIGYKNMSHRGWAFVPHVGVHYTNLHVDKYTESSAGGLGLQVNSKDHSELFADLDLKINKSLAVKSGALTPEFRVSYARNFLRDTGSVVSSFTGGGAEFVVQGLRVPDSTYGIGAGLAFASNGKWSVLADYDLALQDHYTEQTAMLTGKVKF